MNMSLTRRAQATDQIAPVLSSLRGPEPRGRSGPGRDVADREDRAQRGGHYDGASQDQIGFRRRRRRPAPPRIGASHALDLRASFGRLPLTWTETPPSEGAPISFSLQVVAVDLAGNESAPQTVVVEDDGSVGVPCGRRHRPTASTLVELTALVTPVAEPSGRQGVNTVGGNETDSGEF